MFIYMNINSRHLHFSQSHQVIYESESTKQNQIEPFFCIFHTSKSELVVLQLINLLTLSLLIAVVIVLLIGDVLQVQLMMGVSIGPLMLFTPVGHHSILQLLKVENLPPPSIIRVTRLSEKVTKSGGICIKSGDKSG